MKKKCYCVLAFVMAALVEACGNASNGKATTEGVDTTTSKVTNVQVGEADATTDDLQTDESAKAETADNNARTDAEVAQITGELGLHDLRGPVKKCVWKNADTSTTLTFDQNGKWTAVDGNKPWQDFPKVKRDAKGRMVKMADEYDETATEFVYDENGRVTKKSVKYMDGGDETIYYYNADGDCIKTKYTYSDMEGQGETTLTYTILERDSQQNWVKRKDQNGTVEQRTITYYE